MPVIPFRGRSPRVDDSVWIAPDAWITGDVVVERNAAIFFHAVLRGDILPIKVGFGTNVQDGAMLHTSRGLSPCIVGANVTVGHHAIIHGCTVSDLCIIGMNATILDGAEIGTNCIVGANSLVTMNAKIPPCKLVLGSPAKVVRDLTPAEVESIGMSAKSYQKVASEYQSVFKC